MDKRNEMYPYWCDENDWLCAVEFLPEDDPESRLIAADTIGYLFGYAAITNTRSLALLGDRDANAFEILVFVFIWRGEEPVSGLDPVQ